MQVRTGCNAALFTSRHGVAQGADAIVQSGDKAGHRIVGAALTRAVQNPSADKLFALWAAGDVCCGNLRSGSQLCVYQGQWRLLVARMAQRPIGTASGATLVGRCSRMGARQPLHFNGVRSRPTGPYQSVRFRSTDFGQVGFEPERVPTALKPAFYLGF